MLAVLQTKFDPSSMVRRKVDPVSLVQAKLDRASFLPEIVWNIIEQYARSVSIVEVTRFYDRLRYSLSLRDNTKDKSRKIIIGPSNEQGTEFWAFCTSKGRSSSACTSETGSNFVCTSKARSKTKNKYFITEPSRGREEISYTVDFFELAKTELVCMVTGALIVRDDDYKYMRRIPALRARSSALSGKDTHQKSEKLHYYREDDLSFDIRMYHPDMPVRQFVCKSWRGNRCDHAALAIVDDTDWRFYFTTDPILNHFSDVLEYDQAPQRVRMVQFNSMSGASYPAKDVQFDPPLSDHLQHVAVSPNAKWLSVMIRTREGRYDRTSNVHSSSESHIRLFTDIDGVFHQMYCSGTSGYRIMAQWFTRDSSHFVFIVDDQLVRMRLDSRYIT